MDRAVLSEVIACLPKDRTLFRYARGDYALMLLSRMVGAGMRIGEIRQSPYGRLLGKPAVQKLLSKLGDGVLSRSAVGYANVECRQNFLLTVGCWNEERSRYNQTSRNSGNLVLQLNFSSEHDGAFARLIGGSKYDIFRYEMHPILKEGERKYFRHTLAWARMDIEFDTDEVLIEEVQTDWLRYAGGYLRRLERCIENCSRCGDRAACAGRLEATRRYVKEILSPYYGMWDEAMLAAAIMFSADELGITNIYYHSFETGNALKGISDRYPPRSLYTDLPRKFCFEQTEEMPRMLRNRRAVKRKLKRVREPRWYRLTL